MAKLIKLRESFIKYLVAALILAIPLYPKFPFIRIPGTFVSIRLEDTLLFISALIVFLYALPRLKFMFKEPITRAMVLYLTIGLVSALSAIFITQTVAPHIALLHLARRLEYFIPFFLGIIALKNNPKDIHFFFKLLLIVILISFVYGFGQKNFEWPIIITQNQEYSKGVALRYVVGSHINAMFAGHYDLATFLVMVLPIVVSGFAVLKGHKTKLVLGLTFFAGLWLLVTSASRISLVSYLTGISLALFLVKKMRYIPVIVIASIVFIGFSSNLIARYSRLFTVVKERVPVINVEFTHEVRAQTDAPTIRRDLPSPTPTPIPILEDRSSSIRFNVEWPRAIRALSKNPLLGTGYSSITLATDNDYLRLLGETGILGFGAFILIFVRIIELFLANLDSFRKLPGVKYAFVGGFVGALPGLFLNAVFIDIFEASKFAILFWLFAGMVVQSIDRKIYTHD